jgi:peroxiredoxin
MTPEGVRAPAFHLQELTGSDVSLAHLLASGPVLVVFFKVSCPTCQYTVPFLQRLARQSTLAVVGISQDEPEPTSAFCRKYGVEFPVLLDRAKECYPASNAYGITTVPSQFLIQPDGVVGRSFKGFSRRDLEEVSQMFGGVLFSQGEQIPDFKPG